MLKKGTQFSVSFEGIHRDAYQWPEPDKFEPARFDMSGTKDGGKWIQTTDGSPRSPFAHTPFMGGKRVCLGKTFAEVNIRITFPLLMYFLDFEFIDKK
jgi:cytochrome P450